MSYPKKIKIGSIMFRVTDNKKEWKKVCKKSKLDHKWLYGRTDPMKAIIYLNPKQADDVRQLTVWHEVLHGILGHVSAAADWDNLGPKPDENFVQVFDSATLLVLRDNPKLVAYLVKKENHES